MMMEPQITLITFSAVLVILDLNRDTIVDNPNHHVADAQQTPVINAKLSPGGREALNAPRSIVPSMIACRLNQVTDAGGSNDFRNWYGNICITIHFCFRPYDTDANVDDHKRAYT